MERWSVEGKKELHARRTLFKHVISHAFRPSPLFQPFIDAPRSKRRTKKRRWRRKKRKERENWSRFYLPFFIDADLDRTGYTTGRSKSHVDINPEVKLMDSRVKMEEFRVNVYLILRPRAIFTLLGTF